MNHLITKQKQIKINELIILQMAGKTKNEHKNKDIGEWGKRIK